MTTKTTDTLAEELREEIAGWRLPTTTHRGAHHHRRHDLLVRAAARIEALEAAAKADAAKLAQAREALDYAGPAITDVFSAPTLIIALRRTDRERQNLHQAGRRIRVALSALDAPEEEEPLKTWCVDRRHGTPCNPTCSACLAECDPNARHYGTLASAQAALDAPEARP